MPIFIETNEQNDVLASLQELDRQLTRAVDDEGAWKWVIVTLASALNGALTCHLSGAMQVGALKKRVAKETIAALQHDSGQSIPKPFLDVPNELLTRSMSVERIEDTCDPLVLSETQCNSFKLMFEFRNQFLHFSPQGWMIEISGLPKCIRDCLVILDAVADDGWSFRHLTEVEQVELRDLIARIGKKCVYLQELKSVGHLKKFEID